jgi:hypothetical protein
VVKSDNIAIIAYTGDEKKTIGKISSKRSFRKCTAPQHARFLAAATITLTVNVDGDPQREFDNFYTAMHSMIDKYYTVRQVTITSSDPDYVTPAIKSMLRRKNRLMRSGRLEEAGALAKKIGITITRHNSTELLHTDSRNSKEMWDKVKKLTGRRNDQFNSQTCPSVTAEALNNYFADISTDKDYKEPSLKHSVLPHLDSNQVSEWQIFKTLDKLKRTATSQHGSSAQVLHSSQLQ